MAAPTDVDQNDLLAKFREVTGVDEERARFYLEAANWQLQPAMGGFFEGEGTDDDIPRDVPMPTENLQEQEGTQLPGNPTTATGAGGGSASIPSRPKVVRGLSRGGGPITLDALRDMESDSSDDDDNHEAFYTGGSESSGQQVLGPAKNRDEIIAEMFKKAKQMGAVEMTPQMFKKKDGGDETFGGVGHKLGDSVQASSSTSSVGQAVGSASEVQDIVLHLWSDGFTVDDGPLRSYRDPANLAFLDGVKRGEVPVELRQSLRGKDCTLSIMDKRGQDYVPPKSARAFAGRGQTLGSPTPVIIGSTGPSSEDDRKANESTARSNVQLAPGQPTTSIQFRLVDGSRLAAQFNQAHTVQDLYSFINTARPEYSTANYVLTLFPNTELTQKSVSLKEANVLNSALIQKIK